MQGLPPCSPSWLVKAVAPLKAVARVAPWLPGMSRPQIIHSGHFMVSEPHAEPELDPGVPGDAYDFDTVNACTIDASLTKLFECMTLAYSGKIVSPKWKTFKGLKLLSRDKIRLNNAIWRAWYLQYVERRRNPVCNFVTPLECSVGDDHRKPEAVIMEGKYWKRQIGVVIREYHKWRMYFCTRVRPHHHHHPCISGALPLL
uniref:MLX interacting protein like n=1 Tax=Terrapene triunguis TaxID=2587831 RepID=A0A674JUP8_9SAUR